MSDQSMGIIISEREQQYKQLLEDLTDIFSAKVLLDDSGEVNEIHILACSSRDVQQIVSDVRCALNAHFDLDVDHKLISVAQLKENPIGGQPKVDVSAPHNHQQPRLRLGRLTQTVEDNNYEVSLTLKFNGMQYEGYASARNTLQQRYMCVSRATLDAVHKFLDKGNLFALSGVQRITSAPVPMFMVVVDFAQPSGLLVGTAEIGMDEAMSIERATLNAINRKLATLSSTEVY